VADAILNDLWRFDDWQLHPFARWSDADLCDGQLDAERLALPGEHYLNRQSPVSLLVYFYVKIAGSKTRSVHPETGLSSICSGTRTIHCTDRHKRQVISISADAWTVQLRFPDELQTFAGAFPMC